MKLKPFLKNLKIIAIQKMKGLLYLVMNVNSLIIFMEDISVVVKENGINQSVLLYIVILDTIIIKIVILVLNILWKKNKGNDEGDDNFYLILGIVVGCVVIIIISAVIIILYVKKKVCFNKKKDLETENSMDLLMKKSD